MGLQYKITCECGKSYPIEVSQAGQTLHCECGCSIAIPSMLRIKKLPVWEEKTVESMETQQKSDDSFADSTTEKTQSVPSKKENKVHVLYGARFGIFITGIILTLLFSFLFMEVINSPPKPINVFDKRINFKNGDQIIHRNSTPLSQSDVEFYLFAFDGRTYYVSEELIGHFGAYDSVVYFENLKNGLNLSENFYDNFEEIKYQHRIAIVVMSIFLILSFLLIFVPWFMPRRRKVVGNIRGSVWKT